MRARDPQQNNTVRRSECLPKGFSPVSAATEFVAKPIVTSGQTPAGRCRTIQLSGG